MVDENRVRRDRRAILIFSEAKAPETLRRIPRNQLVAIVSGAEAVKEIAGLPLPCERDRARLLAAALKVAA